MLIGVAGLNGSGKGEIVSYLEERSFYALSLSDVIREELRKRGLEPTREQMIESGRELRAAEGPAALAVRLIEDMLPDRNYAIDSVRHPAEVDALRKGAQPFQLWWVDAADETRIERIRARGRVGSRAGAAQRRRAGGVAADRPRRRRQQHARRRLRGAARNARAAAAATARGTAGRGGRRNGVSV